MDLDELLDALDGDDVEDLFRRLKKRARASGEVMKKVATKLVLGVKGPDIGKYGTGYGVLGPYITPPKKPGIFLERKKPMIVKPVAGRK